MKEKGILLLSNSILLSTVSSIIPGRDSVCYFFFLGARSVWLRGFDMGFVVFKIIYTNTASSPVVLAQKSVGTIKPAEFQALIKVKEIVENNEHH